jgi:hypothetical protein
VKGKKNAKALVSPELVKAATAQATASLAARISEVSGALEAQRTYGDSLEMAVNALQFQADAASGVLDVNDPGQRETGWQTAYKRFTSKSAASAVPGGMAHLYDVARNDPDPGQREAAWQRIYETAAGRDIS